MREIIAAAARAGRRDFWRIAAVAVVISTVTALLDISVDHFVDPDNAPLALALTSSAAASSLLGTVLLSGFLTRLVGEAEHGKEHAKEHVTIWRVLRSLPWGRLILADLLVTLLVVLGFLALVIPGLVIFNLLAVVGPVIEIENRRIFAALRRSAHLVRRHFWKVALLATLPVIVASEVEALYPESHSVAAILQALAIRGVGEALLEAAIGLVLGQLCYRLIDLDRRASPHADHARDGSRGDDARHSREPG